MSSKALARWLLPVLEFPASTSPACARRSQFRKLHDLSLINTGLKAEVEVGQELSFGEFSFLDPPFDPSFDPCVRLYGKHLLKEFRWGSGF